MPTLGQVFIAVLFAIWLVFEVINSGHRDDSGIQYVLHVLVQTLIHLSTCIAASCKWRDTSTGQIRQQYVVAFCASLCLLTVDSLWEGFKVSEKIIYIMDASTIIYQVLWIAHQLLLLYLLVYGVYWKLSGSGISRRFGLALACGIVILFAFIYGFLPLLAISDTVDAISHALLLKASVVLQIALLTLGFMCLMLRVYGCRALSLGIIMLETAAMFYHVLELGEAANTLTEPAWLSLLWVMGTSAIFFGVAFGDLSRESVSRTDLDIPSDTEYYQFIFSLLLLASTVISSYLLNEGQAGKGLEAAWEQISIAASSVFALGTIVFGFIYSQNRYIKRTILLSCSQNNASQADQIELELSRKGYYIRRSDSDSSNGDELPATRENLIRGSFTTVILVSKTASAKAMINAVEKAQKDKYSMTNQGFLVKLENDTEISTALHVYDGSDSQKHSKIVDEIADKINANNKWYSFP